jgi:hypothetical protein
MTLRPQSFREVCDGHSEMCQMETHLKGGDVRKQKSEAILAILGRNRSQNTI